MARLRCYEDGKCVSNNMSYSFAAEKDVTLSAHYDKIDGADVPSDGNTLKTILIAGGCAVAVIAAAIVAVVVVRAKKKKEKAE